MKNDFNKLNNDIIKLGRIIINSFYTLMKILFIMLVSTLAGMKSYGLIYFFNKGYFSESIVSSYAHYATYFETAMIAILLYIYIFKNNGNRSTK